MSNSRHQPQVRSYAITHPPGQVQLPTQPGWDYVVFAHRGLFTAMTDDRAWIVPTHRALTVPDGTRIHIETSRRTSIRCLYFQTDLGVIDTLLRLVTLTPLTRELLAHATATAPLNLEQPTQAALVTLIGAQLASEPDTPLHLPLPSDATARHVAALCTSDPSMRLEDCVRQANASRRTLERRFTAETGMSLGQWRRRARILAAVEILDRDASVTSAGLAVGYATPSSFVAAFRSELGAPPREFMQL